MFPFHFPMGLGLADTETEAHVLIVIVLSIHSNLLGDIKLVLVTDTWKLLIKETFMQLCCISDDSIHLLCLDLY